jgi:phosphatidylinositol alpha-1,6-mannosyltransferase
MNILYITRKFPPSIGGMQTQSYEFYKSMSEKNEIHLISWGYSQRYLPVFLVFALIKSIGKLMKERIEIIQLGDLVLSPLGLALKVLFKKPVLTISHGRDSAYRNPAYDLFVLGAARRLDKVICVSGNMKKRLLARGLSAEKLAVIPNGIDIRKAERRGLAPELYLPAIESDFGIDLKGKKMILSVSRLVPKKGLKEFVENTFVNIANEMDDVVLFIAGDGPERNKIKETIGKLGLSDKVHLPGYVEHESPAYKALFSAADAFVMPNVEVKNDAEGFGIVALEASAKGVPVVAYRVDGVAEAVHDGHNGFLIEEGKHRQFAEKVLVFLKDETIRRAFAEKAREYVIKNFGWDVIAGKYLEQYSRILGGER